MKVKLSLMNDRFQQTGSLMPSNVRSARLQDSTEQMDFTPPPAFSGGVQIPFLMKPVRERSDYSKWRTGKIRIDSSKGPVIMDNKGRYFECGSEVKNIKFSERVDRSFDYGANDAARTYYCRPERMDCPSMNRVLDNLHHVPGETIHDRVEMGKVEGASWSVVPRMQTAPAATAHIGPGHYNIHCAEAKYGPLSSSQLVFSVVDAGRGVEDNRTPSSTERRRIRHDRIAREEHPEKFRGIPPSDDFIAAKSTLNDIGGHFAVMDRWKDPQFRKEKYVVTQGLKLELDYDPHMDRSKLPPTFTTTPQRGEDPPLLSKNTNYTVDYGKKESMETRAKTSPVKYSMAFKSKGTVGMQIAEPTSGVHGGPGAFPNAFASVTNVHRPEFHSTSFLAVKSANTSCFPVPENTDGSHDFMPAASFKKECTQGPIFPKGSSGLSEARKQRAEKQVGSVYPALAKKLWPKPAKIDTGDAFKHLKKLKK